MLSLLLLQVGRIIILVEEKGRAISSPLEKTICLSALKLGH